MEMCEGEAVRGNCSRVCLCMPANKRRNKRVPSIVEFKTQNEINFNSDSVVVLSIFFCAQNLYYPCGKYVNDGAVFV